MPTSSFWQQRRILVGICGGIAAYKVATLVSSLAQQGADIRVVMTDAAQAFVTPLTFATLSRHAAYTDADFWHPSQGRPLHIELGEWAEAIVLAPLSAHTLGKLAHGLADNLLTNILLASTCPVLLAPAMNSEMWRAVSVQRNWQQVKGDPRYWPLLPASGRLACDVVGPGRMAEPQTLESALMALLWTQGSPDWQGRQVLISGGGTRDPIDQVRYVGNPASGRMGWALAVAAAWRGASVTFVHGILGFEPAEQCPVEKTPVVTSEEMQAALTEYFATHDVLLMAAAVGDVRPRDPYTGKYPKAQLPSSLPLDPVPDILQTLAQHKRPEQILIGFAAQTYQSQQDPVALAQAKLKAKHLNAIVLNPIDQPERGFGSLTNEALILDAQGGSQAIALCSKIELAHRILDYVGMLVRKDVR